ncbi:MAG: tetratricopeptide repeat protein [Bacteroidetes bacterium]|nr:tetratricopeptide repeat protein [Bacteroidota bacterium]
MKNFILFTLLTVFTFPCVAQIPDSNQMEISDVGTHIQVKFGDSIFNFSYESLSQYYLDQGIEKGSTGDFEKAISHFNLALLYNDSHAEIYYNRGLAYYYMNDYPASINDLTSAIKLDPSYYNALNQRGIAFSKTKEYEYALEDFNTAIRWYPDLSKAYLNKGVNYLLMNDWDEACRWLEIAVEKGDDKAPDVMKDYCH